MPEFELPSGNEFIDQDMDYESMLSFFKEALIADLGDDFLSNNDDDISEYRYGFNGMESDDEVKGEKNSYTTEFRQYDPRIGRWLSLDPKMNKYPWESPYVAFHNNPIYWTDPEGDDPPDERVVNNETAPVLGTLSEINLKVRNKENKNFVNNYVIVDDVKYSLLTNRTDNMLEKVEENIYQDVTTGKYYSMHFVIDEKVPPRKRDDEPKGFYVFSEVIPEDPAYEDVVYEEDLATSIQNTIEKLKTAKEDGVKNLKVSISLTNGLDEETGQMSYKFDDSDAKRFKEEIQNAFPDIEVKAKKEDGTYPAVTANAQISGTKSQGYKQVKE